MKKLPLILCSLILCSVGYSNHHMEKAEQSVFQKAFLGRLASTNEKILSLAEAFSEEQYGWRPAEGIRSVKDTLLHTAAANYGIGSMLGATMPEGLDPWGLEKAIETKAEAIKTLRESIEFATAAIQHSSEEDLATTINLFGNPATKMTAALIIGEHANEHLGQLIAYARSTGVVPPWSK